MVYKKLLKRMPIILLKGSFIYFIALSNTTMMIESESKNIDINNLQLSIFVILISLIVGLIIEVTNEI